MGPESAAKAVSVAGVESWFSGRGKAREADGRKGESAAESEKGECSDNTVIICDTSIRCSATLSF